MRKHEKAWKAEGTSRLVYFQPVILMEPGGNVLHKGLVGNCLAGLCFVVIFFFKTLCVFIRRISEFSLYGILQVRLNFLSESHCLTVAVTSCRNQDQSMILGS